MFHSFELNLNEIISCTKSVEKKVEELQKNFGLVRCLMHLNGDNG